jgi:hypothetical protein
MEPNDRDSNVGQDGKSLEERRYDLDRFKAEQEAKLELRRLALDRAKARQEQRILRNPVLLPAAIAFASVLVSGTQVWVSYISKEKEVQSAQTEKDKELAVAVRQGERQSCVENAKVAINYLNDSGGSKDLKQIGKGLVETACPQIQLTVTNAQLTATNTHSGPPHAILSPTAAEELSIEKVSGDNQVIALNGWKNFSVRVVDQNHRPVEGARVAWRTPDMGSYTYVGTTDSNGVSTATNLYSSSAAGTHQQTADLVDVKTPSGFTEWGNLRPTGKSVTFQFTFSGK